MARDKKISRSGRRSRPAGLPKKVIDPEMQGHIDRLTQQFRESLEERFAGHGWMTLDEMEGEALELREEIGRSVLEEMTQAQVDQMEAQEKKEEPQKRSCQRCQRSRPLRGTGSRTVVTMAGIITLARRVYHCGRCHRCTMPADQILELSEHGYTALVEAWVARLCTRDTPERAMEEFADLAGVYVSVKEAQRITRMVGEYAEAAMKADIEKVLSKDPHRAHLWHRNPEALAPQRHDPWLTGYISMDGVMVPMKGGTWEEAKLARVDVVRAAAKEGQEDTVIQSLQAFHLGGPWECGQQAYVQACRAGIMELGRVVAMGDGAAWIWNQVSAHFPNAIQVLDWCHAVEHLTDAVRVCLTEEQRAKKCGKRIREEELEQKISETREEGKALMWEGDVRGLLEWLGQLTQANDEARRIVNETVGYYENNRTRMKYAEYRAKGLRIGSGAIESACKRTVTARLKGSGMMWSRAGAQAMGHLRALLHSTHRWTEVVGQWRGRGLVSVPLC
jgi:hypothetical protein